MGLSNRLKTLREQKNLSQRKLAKILSMAPSTLAMYETAKRQPDYETLNLFADFFNVTTDYLLGRTDDPTPPFAPKTQTRDEYVLSAPNLPDALIRVAELSIHIDDEEFTRLSRLVIAKFGAPKAVKSSDPAAHTTHGIPGTGAFDGDFDDDNNGDDTGGRNGRGNR